MATGEKKVGVFRMAVGAVVALVLCVVLLWFKTGDLRAPEVVSGSMEPALQRGDRLLVSSANAKNLTRGAIVTFLPPVGELDEELVKRLVGMPGDTVSIYRGTLLVNGQPAPPPGKSESRAPGGANRTVTLGPDEYFLVGDNRENSQDSRDFGPIRRSAIRGVVVYRYLPSDRRGSVQ